MNFQLSEFQASYGLSSQLPASDRPEFVFSGRSNVGKSSLINRLCQRKNLARVSATPGKTATINFYRVDTVYFVDLPGYGYAKVSNAERRRWDELINSYFEAERRTTLLVQLLDSRHAPSADDVQMLEYLQYHQIPFVAALTKADKLKLRSCRPAWLPAWNSRRRDMAAYGEFAWFYDEFNGEADYQALFDYVHGELEANGVAGGLLADLGCGTGDLTLMLSQAGYDVIGIDRSPEMLSVFREKADELGLSGKVLLLCQDILSMELYGTIRAAVSTFDTFNHIGPIQHFEKAVRQAAFFMEKGGVFLFDLNTPYKHERVLGDNAYTIEAPDARCDWQNHYDPAGWVDMQLTITDLPSGQVVRESLREYSYSMETVRAALDRYGFTLVKVSDGEDFGSVRPDSQRWIFTAVKRYTQEETV